MSKCLQNILWLVVANIYAHCSTFSLVTNERDNSFISAQFNCILLSLSRVRMHYGHPDVFDRIFHITRGGISKASRVINISEDIYAGSYFVPYTVKLHHECDMSGYSAAKVHKACCIIST